MNIDKIAHLIDKSWIPLLKPIIESEEFDNVIAHIKERKKVTEVYPDSDDFLNAFKYCSYDKCKVIILGQDPYHNKGTAHGLAFSTNRKGYSPPSLRNIYAELGEEYNDFFLNPTHDLTSWAEQGVLLLNTALTVEQSNAGSHMELWKPITTKIIRAIANDADRNEKPVIFLLWGNHAKEYSQITKIYNNVTTLEAAHPSPFSAHKGFFGCGHFKQTNDIISLLYGDKDMIDWFTIKTDN
jgi:uracil-DNA glycosylase